MGLLKHNNETNLTFLHPLHPPVNHLSFDLISVDWRTLAYTRFFPTIVRLIMVSDEAKWPVCTEKINRINCVESTTYVL